MPDKSVSVRLFEDSSRPPRPYVPSQPAAFAARVPPEPMAKPVPSEPPKVMPSPKIEAPNVSQVPFLEVKDVSLNYGSTVALDCVSFRVNEREIFAIVGANGAGKSSVLTAIARRNTSYFGSILLDGKDIKNDKDLAISSISFVPQ